MLEVYSSDDLIKILAYVVTFGATLILLAYQTVSYYHYRDNLLRDFCVYLFSQTCYLSLAIWMLLVFKSYTESSQILLIAKESLEILTYFFYLIYTTNAIGFDNKKHKLLRTIIKATLITMLIYLPLQLFVIYLSLIHI